MPEIKSKEVEYQPYHFIRNPAAELFENIFCAEVLFHTDGYTIVIDDFLQNLRYIRYKYLSPRAANNKPAAIVFHQITNEKC